MTNTAEVLAAADRGPVEWTVGTTHDTDGNVGIVVQCRGLKKRFDVRWRDGSPLRVILDALESLAYQVKRETEGQNG